MEYLNELIYGLNDFAKLAKCELDQIVQKGSISPSELDSVYKIVSIAEKMKDLESESDMQYGYGYGHPYRYNDYGYGEGWEYSEARRRSPVTGRYISNGMSGRGGQGGYSGHSIEDRMVEALQMQMDFAKSDYERKMIEDEIHHIRAGMQK